MAESFAEILARTRAEYDSYTARSEEIRAHAATVRAEELEPVAAAGAECRRLASDLEAATDHRREVLRFAYRSGRTAAELAGASGLSLARVNQIVAGARK